MHGRDGSGGKGRGRGLRGSSHIPAPCSSLGIPHIPREGSTKADRRLSSPSGRGWQGPVGCTWRERLLESLVAQPPGTAGGPSLVRDPEPLSRYGGVKPPRSRREGGGCCSAMATALLYIPRIMGKLCWSGFEGFERNSEYKKRRKRSLRRLWGFGDTWESPFHKYYPLVWEKGPCIRCLEHPMDLCGHPEHTLAHRHSHHGGLLAGFNFSLGGKKGKKTPSPSPTSVSAEERKGEERAINSGSEPNPWMHPTLQQMPTEWLHSIPSP